MVVRREGVHVREIYEASAARLVAQIYGLTGDFAEAQGVVQEAFARALARPRRFSELDNPESWLRTVAVNLVRSRRRRRAVFIRVVRSGRLNPTDVPPVSPDRVALVAALQRLAPRLREALVLHYIADLPVAEVATTLGCSVDAVKTRLLRERRALAGELADTNPRAVNHV